MNKYFKLRFMSVAIGAALATSSVFAIDDTRGFLRGSATAADGSALGGVTVTITDESKGISRSAVTSADGDYRLPAISSGSYTVTFTQNGKVISESKSISVGIGGKTTHDVDLSRAMEEVVVSAKRTSLTSGAAVKDFIVDTEEFMSRVPVARNLTSVALLSPSAHAADNTFSANNHDSAAVSLGGASIAENACFINGLNTTNFRNGVGCSQVPFQFYDQIQVKNGGYSAEFGRAIGGVMNATTKSGGNEFKFGVNVFWEPDSGREDSPNTYVNWNDEDERSETNVDLWASGAIIQDRLFFYALYSEQSRDKVDADQSRLYDSEWDDDFWGLKLDFVIADGHTLEYTGFDDSRVEEETTYIFDKSSGKDGIAGVTNYFRGGENHTIKYTGVINDWITLNAQYGINEYDRSDIGTTDANPAIYDFRTGVLTAMGNWANFQPGESSDERKSSRIDVDFFVGDHNIRVGIDHEVNTADEKKIYSGGHYYRYYTVGAGSTYDGETAENGYVIGEGDTYVRDRIYENVGSFETETSAYYIQDEWIVSDQLTVHIGIRNESFDNRNSAGDSFIKIDDQWAPRLGVSYNIDDESRVYANYGRYYIPIAANTNIRMAGAENFTADYYILNGLNPDDTPMFDPGTHFDHTTYADGTVPDTAEILDTSIDPMYQDEFVLGYDWVVSDNWDMGVRVIYRELKSTIEDIAIDQGLNTYVEENYGISGFAHGFDYYVLTNPGTDVSFSTDVDGDGILDPITLKADSLGYPDAERTYSALEFSFERQWDDKWMLGGNVVFSKTYGNHEGYVKSDNGQDDAGITTSFDQPGLTYGSRGNLPNDRRWTVKGWGSYKFDNGLLFGANVTIRDGRPINCIGVVPDEVDPYAGAYGAAGNYCGGELAPRDSLGRTSGIFNVDASVQYPFSLNNGSEIVLRADIMNVLGSDNATEVREYGEDDGGSVDPNFLKPQYFQSPRRVRLSATYNF